MTAGHIAVAGGLIVKVRDVLGVIHRVILLHKRILCLVQGEVGKLRLPGGYGLILNISGQHVRSHQCRGSLCRQVGIKTTQMQG